MRTSSVSLVYRNRLLASLPTPITRDLEPNFTRVELLSGRTIHESNQNIDSVYFLEDGLCAIIATMTNGISVEVGILGAESCIGLPLLLGVDRSPHRSLMLISGHAYRLPAKMLERQLAAHPDLRVCLLNSMYTLHIQTAQTAACNRVHELLERLARWLLDCHDRIHSNVIPITHDFLAAMLGTRRSSVTVAAGLLQRAGLISYARGIVTILNLHGLIDAACECYGIVRKEYIRIGLLDPELKSPTFPVPIPALENICFPPSPGTGCGKLPF